MFRQNKCYFRGENKYPQNLHHKKIVTEWALHTGFIYKSQKKFSEAPSQNFQVGNSFRPVLAAYQNFFSCCFFLSHVGIVPEGYLMAIFICDWRCKFLLMFLFVTEKKSFDDKFWSAPRSSKTLYVLVNPKVIYQNFV